ncbi:MAG TPA: sugar transferase [Solirubrobacterales bacterium]|jgi:lipopolysaccharide/colanic/teichoic acid biosynthesis glycosyltransferase|nr:sugar transferase [Solirubrobacterales bacterium]
MEAHGLTRTPEQGLSHLASEPRSLAALRRLVDIVFALGLILLLSPILIAVAVAVRLDSRGPALFRQRRVGLEEREFTLFKLRSMRLDADPRGHQEYVTALIKGSEADSDATPDEDRESLYKLAVDNRITPVGRWIRRWSLDELPQLFNVVLGDMTLVGPRPSIPYEVAEYPTWYLQRFSVKPGLTGLWQVSGRSERSYEEMVRLDVQYTERRSLALDLSILVKTPWVVLSRKGAA